MVIDHADPMVFEHRRGLRRVTAAATSPLQVGKAMVESQKACRRCWAGEGSELRAICDDHYASTRVLALVPPLLRRRAFGNRRSGVTSARPRDGQGSPAPVSRKNRSRISEFPVTRVEVWSG